MKVFFLEKKYLCEAKFFLRNKLSPCHCHNFGRDFYNMEFIFQICEKQRFHILAHETDFLTR